MSGQSSFLADLLNRWDLIMGSEWSFHLRGDRSSAYLSFSVVCFVRDGSPRGASPILFPSPESPGGLLECVSRSLGRLGAVRFPSPFVGWGLDQVGETFLSRALVPLLCLRRVWFAFHPLPFSWFSRLSSIAARCVSLQFRAVSRPLTMSWPEGLGSHALSWIFLCSLEISRCPANLPCCVPPPGVVALFLQDLARDLCVPFSLRLSGFLTRSPLFLLVLASFGFPSMLHVLHFKSLTAELRLVCPSPPSHIVVAKVLDLLYSSFCRLLCTGCPNVSTIALETFRFSGAVRFSLPVTSSALWPVVLPC